MADSNGFKLRGHNSAANRVSVQSNVQTTWMLGRARDGAPQWHEIGMTRDELIVIKCQDGAESAEIEIIPLGDRAGTLIGDSSRRGARTMRVGTSYIWVLEPGEALVLRTSRIVHPTHAGAGLSV